MSNKNIIDLAHGNHIKSGLFECIKRSLSKRRNRIIVTVARALELALFLSDIRAGNDASDLPLILHRQLSRNLTATIEFLKTKRLLISADLKHRICRGVNNHMTGRDLFLSELIEDCCSTRTLISDYLVTGALLKLCNQLRRKSVIRKCDKRLYRL